LGEKRIAARLAPPAGSANMLQVAKSLCREVMPSVWRNFDAERGRPISADTSQAILDGSSLIFKNGDAAMWQRLCTFQNPQPVMAVTALQRGGASGELAYVLDNVISEPTSYALYDRAGYKNGFVGDESGAVSKVTDKIDDANLRPWCFKKPTDPSVFTALENDWKRVNDALKAAGKKDRGPIPPYCPPGLLGEPAGTSGDAPNYQLTEEQVETWTRRGAANAGLSVFLYLDALAKSLTAAKS
jgi:hypothetical protein